MEKVRCILSVCILVFSHMTAFGQQPLSNKYYQLGWDNDVFMMTDYYYSQGMSFGTYHPFFKYNPVNLILIKPKGYKEVVYGFSGFQRTYTPKNLKSDEIQYTDRPYAGVLVFTSHARATNAQAGWLFSSELDIGVMGPASGAGHVQYRYHEWSDNTLPNGWHHQQYNWPVLNYNFEATKQLYEVEGFEFYAKGGARLGTLHDDASVGLLLRAGKMDSYMESMGLPLMGNTGKWQMYFNTEPTITVVGYNATLMGGWHRNEKIHYVEFNEMEKIIGRWRTGLGASYKSFGINFDVILQSKEFKGGAHHWYTSTRLFINF
ncbi:lipid A deacylase LpxR family protein [Carboxylicivirga marina]|uniref:lipid A deacylase LpxR family protein n=1 Tax=Carboxylicivirga marina TaxID=2800988 RepID=UPI002592E031|nr:lipid A deacylase LpxR family protein [uncultured Carboxylicivirga sp.]